VQAQPVVEQRALADPRRLAGQPEPQPRRGDLLEVLGRQEEREDLLERRREVDTGPERVRPGPGRLDLDAQRMVT
jgi:hypothetical protein